MGEIRTHKDLKVWQKSIELVISVYELTKQYPKEELYAITNQIRRCVTSIPANTVSYTHLTLPTKRIV